MKVEFVNHIIKQGVFRKSLRVRTKQKIKTMKKIILTTCIVASITLSFSSCKKCGYCLETDGTKSDKVCKNDNETAYELAKAFCDDGTGAKWVE